MSLGRELFEAFKIVAKQTKKTTKEACGIINNIRIEEGLTVEQISKSKNMQELKATLKEISK